MLEIDLKNDPNGRKKWFIDRIKSIVFTNVKTSFLPALLYSLYKLGDSTRSFLTFVLIKS